MKLFIRRTTQSPCGSSAQGELVLADDREILSHPVVAAALAAQRARVAELEQSEVILRGAVTILEKRIELERARGMTRLVLELTRSRLTSAEEALERDQARVLELGADLTEALKHCAALYAELLRDPECPEACPCVRAHDCAGAGYLSWLDGRGGGEG